MIIGRDQSSTLLSYTGPIGDYEYEGISYASGDTNDLSGSFRVEHEQDFYLEIAY